MLDSVYLAAADEIVERFDVDGLLFTMILLLESQVEGTRSGGCCKCQSVRNWYAQATDRTLFSS